MPGVTAPRAITAADGLADFESGEPSLDEYLRKRALFNHVEGGSRCYVACRDGRVVGYYALAAATVTRTDVPGKIRRNMPEPVPAVLLSRLAVDAKQQGSGLGVSLLRDAILRTVNAADLVGVRIMLVHALHERARRFYERFDFEQSLTDPLHLFLLMKDARAALSG